VDAGAQFSRARTLAAMGRTAEAVALLTEILAVDPAHHGSLLLRADLHAEEREWEKALVLNERAATLWPRSAEALASRGSIGGTLTAGGCSLTGAGSAILAGAKAPSTMRIVCKTNKVPRIVPRILLSRNEFIAESLPALRAASQDMHIE